jgi:hypothetical protein
MPFEGCVSAIRAYYGLHFSLLVWRAFLFEGRVSEIRAYYGLLRYLRGVPTTVFKKLDEH